MLAKLELLSAESKGRIAGTVDTTTIVPAVEWSHQQLEQKTPNDPLTPLHGGLCTAVSTARPSVLTLVYILGLSHRDVR